MYVGRLFSNTNWRVLRLMTLVQLLPFAETEERLSWSEEVFIAIEKYLSDFESEFHSTGIQSLGDRWQRVSWLSNHLRLIFANDTSVVYYYLTINAHLQIHRVVSNSHSQWHPEHKECTPDSTMKILSVIRIYNANRFSSDEQLRTVQCSGFTAE